MKKFIEPEVKILPLMIQDEVTLEVGGISTYSDSTYTGSGGIVLPEDEF